MYYNYDGLEEGRTKQINLSWIIEQKPKIDLIYEKKLCFFIYFLASGIFILSSTLGQ